MMDQFEIFPNDRILEISEDCGFLFFGIPEGHEMLIAFTDKCMYKFIIGVN